MLEGIQVRIQIQGTEEEQVWVKASFLGKVSCKEEKKPKEGAGRQNRKQTGLINMHADRPRTANNVCRQSGKCELLVDR